MEAANLARVTKGDPSSANRVPSPWKRVGAGALAGALAGIVMTTVMLLLLSLFGIATPLTVIGDRLSVFIPADTFLALMGKIGGYNRMKQLGVGSVMAGQILVGTLGGILYGLIASRYSRNARSILSLVFFVLLPSIAVTVALWPVMGTHYMGYPIAIATALT